MKDAERRTKRADASGRTLEPGFYLLPKGGFLVQDVLSQGLDGLDCGFGNLHIRPELHVNRRYVLRGCWE